MGLLKLPSLCSDSFACRDCALVFGGRLIWHPSLCKFFWFRNSCKTHREQEINGCVQQIHTYTHTCSRFAGGMARLLRFVHGHSCVFILPYLSRFLHPTAITCMQAGRCQSVFYNSFYLDWIVPFPA